VWRRRARPNMGGSGKLSSPAGAQKHLTCKLTNLAACTARLGVRRLMVPTSSSSPQRPHAECVVVPQVELAIHRTMATGRSSS